MEVKTKFQVPILLLIFNRPDCTSRVFEQIAELKPSRLYIAADGPRANVSGEKAKCSKTREVATKVDWDCEVKLLFRDNNLGCKNAISSAITWFFEQEEEGIILEDDCIPDQTFFSFCADLLERYRHNERVMHIGGSNLHPNPELSFSYYFTNYNHVWGWASWRRAWRKYDKDLHDFPEFLAEKKIDNILGSRAIKYSWLYKFWRQFHGKIDTWDYQWTYTIWKNSGISITPTKNLVTNVGFNSDATHTKIQKRSTWEVAREAMVEISHPTKIVVNEEMDRITDKTSYNSSPLKNFVFWLVIQSVRRKLIK